jgi:hypothetical protein
MLGKATECNGARPFVRAVADSIDGAGGVGVLPRCGYRDPARQRERHFDIFVFAQSLGAPEPQAEIRDQIAADAPRRIAATLMSPGELRQIDAVFDARAVGHGGQPQLRAVRLDRFVRALSVRVIDCERCIQRLRNQALRSLSGETGVHMQCGKILIEAHPILVQPLRRSDRSQRDQREADNQGRDSTRAAQF